MRDPHKRAHYDSTLSGGDGAQHAYGPGAGGYGGFKHTGFKAPTWESREAERKMWEEMKTQRHYTRAQWNEDRRRMEEQMRKSEQMEALRRMMQPYFNLALVLSLIALGATSLYIQYQSRGKPRAHQNFAPAEDDMPTYFSKYRAEQQQHQQQQQLASQPREAEPYPPVDPHRKYHTKWDDINESVKRRDDFYRALLRGDETYPSSPHSSKASSVS